MAEIKLNDNFIIELSEFKVSADELIEHDYYKIRTEDDLSLSVIDEYRDRISRLWEQVFRFKLLVQKDVKDMETLTQNLRQVDRI